MEKNKNCNFKEKNKGIAIGSLKNYLKRLENMNLEKDHIRFYRGQPSQNLKEGVSKRGIL